VYMLFSDASGRRSGKGNVRRRHSEVRIVQGWLQSDFTRTTPQVLQFFLSLLVGKFPST
jgi:hypothetical protein